jgi:type IV secretion system protein VirD4
MRARGETGPELLDAVLLALLATAVLIAITVDVIGGLAGLIFGDRWVDLPLAEMPAVLERLPSSLADPQRAWPIGVQPALPGPAGFAAAFALALLLLGGAAAGLIIWRASRRREQPTPARWAQRRDLAPLRVSASGGGRVVLGRIGRTLIAAETRESVLVVAPTQTGKTTGLAVPAILEWDGPVLATSRKSDLVRDTLLRRSAVGDIRLFDPAATTGLPRAHWTPLARCGDWQSARRTADRLTKAAQSSPRSSGMDGEFWAQAGSRFLAPLLMAAALTNRGIADVVRWIDAEDHEEVLDALDHPEHEAARNAAIAVWSADDRLRSSLYVTANLALEAYTDPTVLACSRRADLTPAWLLDGGANTAYLCAPLDEQARLRPLYTTLVREIVGEVYATAARTGRPLERPLLVVLDEAANIAPVPDLDQVAATGAGQGVQLVTVFQDLAQVHQRWGAKADTIVNNHRAKLFGPAISCARTLDYLRRILGDAELSQRSETSAERGRRSTTRSSTFRAIAPPNALREARADSMLLVYGTLPPARIAMRPWFRDRRLRDLAGADG